jgi:hypothetical protein
MSDPAEIFVKLVDEGVDVWRPVQATHLRGNIYRIIDQQYDCEVEVWQFEPGDVVVCELVDSDDGRILAATELRDNG